MYWPIGAPKAYALTKHARSSTQVQPSHDGAAENKTGEGHDGSQKQATGGGLNGAASQNDTDHQSTVDEDEILAAQVSRGGGIFATITRSSLTIWQTKPTVALSTVIRSSQSIKAYGPSTALLLRPDAQVIVVQTALGYLITYSSTTEPNARVYHAQLPSSHRNLRANSVDGYNNYRRPSALAADAAPGEADGIKEVSIRFRMVMRIDAGIIRALALDEELIIATHKPAAIQCIRWAAESGISQTKTELISRMPWMDEGSSIAEMVFDRPMNLHCWITLDGRAYAVQRQVDDHSNGPANNKTLFEGFCFRQPETGDTAAVMAAINARFSLIAVGCTNGTIDVYTVKDYAGNIPLSHKLAPPPLSTSCGKVRLLSYSPDGYCLFVGYEYGWAMWSVYGKALASSFGTDRVYSDKLNESWLHGARYGFWVGGGCEFAVLCKADETIWMIEMARSAMAGCLSPPNVSRSLLHTSTSMVTYHGHEVRDLTALPSDLSLWRTVQIPAAYLASQWPVKLAAVSPDGRYVAVAGRRGLAHYSVGSGRWRTFEDPLAEQEFAVRGGMCWHQHFLIVSVEMGGRHQVRVYSREKALEASRAVCVEELQAPAILTTTCGNDSLLVYTYDNTLLHYILVPSGNSVKLVQVGQIGFHGIIRAPPRVRAISWILPEGQLEHGDPSQDVATASVLFLVDGKLVLLQPSTNELGELKYDMRVIAQSVEYYSLLRDQPSALASNDSVPSSHAPTNELALDDHLGHSLRDSLWYFDGSNIQVWSDVHDVLASAPAELGRELPATVRIPMDFHPSSVMVDKGIIHGIEAELVQRKDVNFSYYRHVARTQLFLPQLLRYHLAEYNSPAALHLADSYQHLPYFAHALEVLLHDVLDAEVDIPPDPPETALLPTVISFLSSFPAYLDIVVNCTRKTELRSWRTLFSYLPPVLQLFEQALEQGKLKTAAGYLLILHTFEQDSFQTHDFARLIRLATVEADWDLCGELARFLVGIDATGQMLHAALSEAGLRRAPNGGLANGFPSLTGALQRSGNNITVQDHAQRPVHAAQINGVNHESIKDYFSMSPPD